MSLITMALNTIPSI